ncbi:MAG: hypothetical protein CME63_05350 [Halobacteriovoraceae bacterium]|nr:hypothetical protein [Halobacteriovoraceae bacterium]MBC97153.1 hypothetical protein [Halobacteriovoraceae bacterium]|tara:strand:- start:255 stop:1628 length:1374 start_codon:yes stop_codon:yes gene_type:complete
MVEFLNPHLLRRYMKGIPLKKVLFFSLPIIAGQMGQMLFGTGDLLVAGRYSREVVSALGVATTIFSPFLMLGLGLTFAISAITSRIIGEGKKEDDMLFNSLLIAGSMGVILSLALYLFSFKLEVFGLIRPIEDLVIQYLQITAISIIPALLYQVYKEYLQSYGHTYVSNGAILFFNVTNIILNIVLMFGYDFGIFIIPEMGIHGAALSTVITRTLMFLTLSAYAHKKFKMKVQVNRVRIKEILSLGMPIGLSTLSEVLVFTTVTVLVGRMNVLASASHNIVLNLGGLTFMVPLAIGSSASVFVAEQFGKKNPQELLRYALACIIISTAFMSLTAIIFFAIPSPIIRLATPDPKIITYASTLLFYVALFQVPDGIQVTLWGVLRGMATTKLPLIMCIIINWLIGLPFGIYLVNEYKMQAAGLWAGLALGLTLMSVVLGFIFYCRYKSFKLAPHSGDQI